MTDSSTSPTPRFLRLLFVVAALLTNQCATEAGSEPPREDVPVNNSDLPLTPFSLRIDCGAASGHVDPDGRVWTPDRDWVGGGGTADRGTVTIENTKDDVTYRTERWGMSGYSIPVPNGTYTVKLHFSETIYDGPERRVMDVDVEGQRLPHYDVLVAAGGMRRARVESFRPIAIADGRVDIKFGSQVGGTKVDGIEILPDQAPPPPNSLVVYPDRGGIARSLEWAVTVNGKPVNVLQVRASTEAQYVALPHENSFELSGMAAFDFKGEVTVEIVPKGRAWSSVQVRPSWKGVTPRISGGKIRLTLREPTNIVVELDGSRQRPLFLFANPPEVAPPLPNTAGVRYYGPGVHNVGYVPLASNQTVYIAGGAVVRGTFVADNAKNVTIRGRGILDGSTAATHSTHMMRFDKVNGLRIEGVTLLDSPSWNMPIYRSADVSIQNLKILGYRQNTDCVDLVSVKSVVVDSSFLRCFDDGVTVKAYDDEPSYDIAVRNTTVWTDWGVAGFVVGSELRAPRVEHVTFQNSDILHPNSHVIAISNSDDARVSDVSFGDIRVEEPRRGDIVRLFVGKNIYSEASSRGNIDGVTVAGLRLLSGDAMKSSLEGFDAAHAVANVNISGMWLKGKHVTSIADANMSTNAFVRDVVVRP